MSTASTIDRGSIRVLPVLGTMTFGGPQTSEEVAAQQVSLFAGLGYREIDTARMYQAGATEDVLGRILKGVLLQPPSDKMIIASKVNCFPQYNKSLSPESVRMQSDQILAALQTDHTDILFLHSPDVNTKIEDTLEAVQSLYKMNRFKEFGLSNYAGWEVAYIYMYMQARNYILPTVYEGMYNAITRDVEKDLFMCLHKFNIRFHAYNPLAGGLLTGKHMSDESKGSNEASAADSSSGTRFDKSNVLYRSRYWKAEYFKALTLIKEACEKESIEMADASLRWIVHHSMLSGARNDRVIVGASCLAHLERNLTSCASPPLPQSVVDAFDEAWSITKANCEKYFRP